MVKKLSTTLCMRLALCLMMMCLPMGVWADIISTDVSYSSNGSRCVIKFDEYKSQGPNYNYWKTAPTLKIDGTEVLQLGTLWSDLNSANASVHTAAIENTVFDNNQQSITLNGETIGTAKFQNHEYSSPNATLELCLTFNQSFSFYGHQIELAGRWGNDKATNVVYTTYMNGYARPTSFQAAMSGTDVALSWTAEKYNDNASTSGSWYIYRGTKQLGNVAYGTTSYTDRCASVGTQNYTVVFVPSTLTASANIPGLSATASFDVTSAGSHTFTSESNGYCTVCGANQEAVLVTAGNRESLGVSTEHIEYYAVGNAGQLRWVNEKIKGGQNYLSFVLTDNISFNRKWEDGNNYYGTIDGNGYVIRGLSGFWLFPRLYGTIKNLGFINGDLISSVAGLENHGTISNCYFSGSAGSGFCEENCGTIENCYAIGNLGDGGFCGGYKGTIKNCYTTKECFVNAGTINVDDNVTTERFASGEIAYLLNGTANGDGSITPGPTDGTQMWYQKLGDPSTGSGQAEADPYPVLRGAGSPAVYRSGLLCNGNAKYSNTKPESEVVQDPHLDEDNDGYCENCKNPINPPAVLTAEACTTLGLSMDHVGYYGIADTEEFDWYTRLVKGTLPESKGYKGTFNAVLLNDIDLSSFCGVEIGNWESLGKDDSHKFTGTFDGNGKTIKNLYINTTSDYQGLFGYSSGTIKNLTIKGSVTGGEYVGGLCSANYGTITHCTNFATVSGSKIVGGVCAENYKFITYCHNAGIISGNNSIVAGIAGLNYDGFYTKATISNSYNTGKITGKSLVGGICGSAYGYITNCYNEAQIEGSGEVGGICGGSFKSITNCYNRGQITANNRYGGIVGVDMSSGSINVSRCYILEGTTQDNYSSSKTVDEFASGEVTFQLNGETSTGTLAWYQNLDENGDAYPVLKATGSNTVYKRYTDCQQFNYSNSSYDEANRMTPFHVTNSTFVCTVCGAEPTSLATAALADKSVYARTTGLTIGDFTYTRTFSSTAWTSWYVPFELELTDELLQKYAFSRINNVHQYDRNDDGVAEETVIESFRQRAGTTLRANYPYLVKPLSDEYLNMTLQLSNCTLAKAEEKAYSCRSVDYRYTFSGTYSGKGDSGAEATSPYALFGDGNWYHYTSLPAQRHYLTIEPTSTKYNAAAPARIMLVETGEEDVTGIVNLNVNPNPNLNSSGDGNNEIFNLKGQRLAAPQKGLQIKNGKVVYIK